MPRRAGGVANEYPGTPITSAAEVFLVEVEVLQGEAGATGDAVRASSATEQGHAGTMAQQLVDVAQQRAAADMTMPLSMMSLESSGGVCSRTRRTAPMICWSRGLHRLHDFRTRHRIVRGRPAISRGRGAAADIHRQLALEKAAPSRSGILISSAVRSLAIIRLYFLRRRSCDGFVDLGLPPTRRLVETTNRAERYDGRFARATADVD